MPFNIQLQDMRNTQHRQGLHDSGGLPRTEVELGPHFRYTLYSRHGSRQLLVQLSDAKLCEALRSYETGHFSTSFKRPRDGCGMLWLVKKGWCSASCFQLADLNSDVCLQPTPNNGESCKQTLAIELGTWLGFSTSNCCLWCMKVIFWSFLSQQSRQSIKVTKPIKRQTDNDLPV